MTVVNFVDPAHRVVITTCSGVVTFDDAVTCLATLRKDPDFRPDFRQLADISQASDLIADLKNLHDLRLVHDPFSNQGKRAVVTAPSGVSLNLARTYQSIVDSPNFRVFQSLLDAISWLGLEVTILDAAIQRLAVAREPERQGNKLILDLPHDVPISFRPIARKTVPKPFPGPRRVSGNT